MKNIQNKLMLNTDEIIETTLSKTTRNVLMNHLSSFQNNDLDAVMSDYTSESVLITQAATYTGTEEIKIFFADLVIHFPKQKSNFELDIIEVKDELALIVWHAKTPSLEVSLGTDTFILKDGKIYQQTFVGQLIWNQV
ncbi:MAG: nuclear transport factor 2 family protein [Ferruginibacter sp.]